MSTVIALAGNPNSGKTTLFNSLTGANQFVGNWPGVTVEKKEGQLRGCKDVTIVDLPGIYSLSPYSLEEVVARDYLLETRPDVILNIIDGTNLERNLYLTAQLMETGIPLVAAVNQIDAVEKAGGRINVQKLSDALGCPVVALSALKGKGVREAAALALKTARNPGAKSIFPFDSRIEAALSKIENRLSERVTAGRRFYALKLFERDERILKKYPLPDLESILKPVEAAFGDDSESLIITTRYDRAQKIVAACAQKTWDDRPTSSEKIDRILMNRLLALPIFGAVMFLIYFLSVTTVGALVTGWVAEGVFGDGWSFLGLFHVPGIPVIAANLLEKAGAADWLASLVLNGIIPGVGGVLSFVPQMLLLFLLLAFLEACGYMARIAFMLDSIFRRFGLSGKSFIPLLIGTGCGVPGIMASRTIENPCDRRITIMTTTFVPCGAKLPIIALIAGSLFGGDWWVAPSAYFLGIGAVALSGIILKKAKPFIGAPSPFVMELPLYRWPTARNLLRNTWDRTFSFIKKAGSIILISSVVVWFLSNFGFQNGRFGMVGGMEEGLLADIGRLLAVLFRPLGFGDWASAVAVLTGLVAKENIVSTMSVLLSDGNLSHALARHFTSSAGYAFLAFNLLCAPCLAAIAAIRREMQSLRWTLFALGYQTACAYGITLMIYQFSVLAATGRVTTGTFAAFLTAALILYLLFRPQPEGGPPSANIPLPPAHLKASAFCGRGCKHCPSAKRNH